MTMKFRTASALAVALAASLITAQGAAAHDKRLKRADAENAHRDCTPYNGPYGYYGNPWCDGGYKLPEDYAPGTGPYLDLLDLPQVRRYRRAWD